MITISQLFNYIQSDAFVPMNGIDNGWLKELKDCLAQMCNDPNHPKLCIYHYPNSFFGRWELLDAVDAVGTIDGETLNTTLFSFQLNPKHPWFQKTDRFNAKKEAYTNQYKLFHLDCQRFHAKDTVTINLKNDCGTLEKMKTLLHRIDGDEINDVDIDYMMQIIDNKQISFEMNEYTPAHWLKKKISKLFGNLIDVKYIELRNGFGFERLQRNNPIKYRLINCYFVLYDTHSMDAILQQNEMKIYKPCIFTPSQVSHFHQSDCNNTGTQILIPYMDDTFKFQDFFNYIVETIKQSSDNILYDAYKEILDLSQDDNTSMLIPQLIDIESHKAKLLNLSDTSFHHQSHQINGTTVYYMPGDSMDMYDIYMFSDQPLPNKIKLKIKMAGTQPDGEVMEFIGLPLIVWVDGKESIQSIVDKHLCRWENKIEDYFRITANNKMHKIEQENLNLHSPFLKNLWNPDDFLMFTLDMSLMQHPSNPIIYTNVDELGTYFKKEN